MNSAWAEYQADHWIDELTLSWADEVRVWLVDLDPIARHGCQVVSLLSAEELERASRFLVALGRDQYIGSHAALRLILGECTGVPPEELRFTQSTTGKPALTRIQSGGRIGFNLSHSGRFAVIGVSTGREIGVDIEGMQESRDLTEVADLCFTPAERVVLAQAAPSNYGSAFCRFWTRKEAVLKACGRGITSDLQTLDVSGGLALGEKANGLRVSLDDQVLQLWDLSPAPAYEAALALLPYQR